MRHRRRRQYLILWVGLLLTVGFVWVFGKRFKSPESQQKESKTSSQVSTSENSQEKQNEARELGAGRQGEKMAGVWVSYLSLATKEKTEQAFKARYEEIVKTAKDTGLNALFVQVRPFCDALYPSEIYPWSHILTGTQGQDPGFDPLAYMVDYAHKNEMRFHAWINPLRIKTNETPANLAENHPYAELKSEYPFYFMEHEGALYLNPAYAYIRNMIADGAAEIVQKYPVDGIHFDDYFYPAQTETLDQTAYQSYLQTVETPISLEVYREANINTMITKVYERIKQTNPEVVFGISPSGNLASNATLYADVRSWCAYPGYIDYICPQLYYSYENPALPYAQALSDWMSLQKHSKLEIYVGLGIYKAGTPADEGTWEGHENIIRRQIEDAEKAGCAGFILYSAEYLSKPETEKEVKNVVAFLTEAKENSKP